MDLLRYSGIDFWPAVVDRECVNYYRNRLASRSPDWGRGTRGPAQLGREGKPNHSDRKSR